MKVPISSSRCISILGPNQSGKTTLMESILQICGQIHQKGNVKDSSTLSDHLPEEQELKMSVLNMEVWKGAGNFTFLMKLMKLNQFL